MTFLAALRCDRLEAPWLLDGPIDGESFRLYVERVLVPTLRPGDVVVMDNLGSHKSAAVRRAIRAVGARLFLLPKYSPDLNPIEKLFAKLKHWLRKAAARTPDAVCAAIAHILDTITAASAATTLSRQAMPKPKLSRYSGRRPRRWASPAPTKSPASMPRFRGLEAANRHFALGPLVIGTWTTVP